MLDEHEEEPSPPGPRRRRRRRVPGQLVAFAGVLGAGVLIGWVAFGDDDPPAPARTSATLDQRTRIDVNRRRYQRLGMSLSLPKGWDTTFRQGVFNAASADDRVSVAISAAGGAGDERTIRAGDRRELKRLFAARELNRRRGRFGTAPTIITELVGRTRNRRQIRILSMGASSRWRTYSVQIFTVLRPAPDRLVELSTLVASVRFSRPS